MNTFIPDVYVPALQRGVFTAESLCKRVHWHDKKNLQDFLLISLLPYLGALFVGSGVPVLLHMGSHSVHQGKAASPWFKPLAPIVQSPTAPG